MSESKYVPRNKEALEAEARMLRGATIKKLAEDKRNMEWELNWLKDVLEGRLPHFVRWFQLRDFQLGDFKVPFVIRYADHKNLIQEAKVDADGSIYIRLDGVELSWKRVA